MKKVHELTVHPLCSMSQFAEANFAPINLAGANESAQNVREIETLKESIQTVGIIEPLVVDAKNRVVNGVRRLRAAVELGLFEVPCSVIESSQAVTNIYSSLSQKDITKTARLWLTAVVWYPLFCEIREDSCNKTGGKTRAHCFDCNVGFIAQDLQAPDDETLEELGDMLDQLRKAGRIESIKDLARHLNISRRSLDYVAEMLDILSAITPEGRKEKMLVLNKSIFFSKCGAERLKSSYIGGQGDGNTPTESDKNFALNFDARLSSAERSAKLFISNTLRKEFFSNTNWEQTWTEKVVGEFAKLSEIQLKKIDLIVNKALGQKK